MRTDQLLDILHSNVSNMWVVGEEEPVKVKDYISTCAAEEIERLSAKVWFWRTLSLVLTVGIVAIAATANAQGAPKEIEPHPGRRNWTTIPLNNVPSTCTKIGDKTVCKSGERVQTCIQVGVVLYCKEGY